MRFYKLSDQDMVWLDGQPETAMGLQVVIGKYLIENPIYIAGGQVAIDLWGANADQLTLERSLLDQPWFRAGDRDVRREQFHSWRSELEPYPLDLEGRVVLSRAELYPFGRYGSPPPLPANVYGHLPYWSDSEGTEVFYRWEPFPTSRRVDQAHGTIAAGTYCAPASEAPFVPTGFAAVGRFALPGLSPANWRWELRPPTDTRYHCGASVPLYGQAGGGVEAAFPNQFINVGPIANQFVIPSL